MSFLVCSREQFLEWIAHPRPIKEAKALTLLPAGLARNEILLVWDKQSSKNSHPLLVVPGKQIADFFAFANTYVSTYSPISAFFRILSVDGRGNLRAQIERFTDQNTVEQIAPQSIVGVAIAEAFAQIGRVRSLSEVSVQACLGTMSSSVIASIASGCSGKEIASVAQAWLRARQAFSAEQLRLPQEALAAFWAVAGPALAISDEEGTNTPIGTVIRHFLIDGRLDHYLWRSAIRQMPDIAEAPEHLAGTREDRVREFDRFMRILGVADHVDQLTRDFAVGTLLALLGEGSYEYLPLAQSFAEVFPGAILWFALITSLHVDNDALVSGQCLGRRVAREVFNQRSIFSPPEVDISLEELEVIGVESKGDRTFRTEHQTVASVEIFPNVSAKFRMPKERSPESDAVPWAAERTREMKYLLQRMSKLLSEIEFPQRQRELFPERKAKKAARQIKD